MYGSKLDASGKEISANGVAPNIHGQHVPGNAILGIEFAKNEDGSVNEDKAYIRFKQSNGANFQVLVFNSENKEAVAITNRTILHICTKFVTEVEYYQLIAGSTSFKDFVIALKDKVFPRANGKLFTMKIVLKKNNMNNKYYTSLPSFPSFIELDGTAPSTLSPTNPVYDIYEMPAVTTTTAAAATNNSSDNDVF